jgi:hypothetical protein
MEAVLKGITPLFRVCAMFTGVTLADEVYLAFEAPRVAPAVIHAPYSADQVMQTPADETHIKWSGVIGHFYRDSQGRTRMEEAQKAVPVLITTIVDPVGGFGYFLDDQKKVAHRMVLQPASAARKPATQTRTMSEKLGTLTVEGVICEGTRTTTTFSGGKMFTLEEWYSEELKVTVLSKNSYGGSIALTNLRRGEPDPSRFQPPPNYTVVDDKNSFTMTIKVGREEN